MYLFSFFLTLLFSTLPPMGDRALGPNRGLPAPAVSAPDAALYISTDQGNNWNNFADGLPEKVQVRDVIEHQDDLYLSTSNSGVYVLPKDGCAWESRSSGLPIGKKDFYLHALAAHGDVVVAGTYQDGIYLSKDGGANWRRAMFNVNSMVLDLLFTDELLLAGTENGVWQSYDLGESWQRRSGDMTSINALAIHNDQVFVAKQNGIGMLKENDIIWSDVKTEWAIGQLLPQGEYVYAITARNEVFRSKDGSFWEPRLLSFPNGLPNHNLSEALWSGFKAKLPNDLPAGMVTETSRGWICGVNNGC